MKWVGWLLVVVFGLPVAGVGVALAYVYLTTAFPTAALAAERFEASLSYAFPANHEALYFRLSIGSPMDLGGAALRMRVTAEDAATMRAIERPWIRWDRLPEPITCDCVQCLRYAEPVVIPAGADYWMRGKFGADYALFAVTTNPHTVYWCMLDV